MTESNVGVVKSALPVDDGWRHHLGNRARACHAASTAMGELGC